MRPDLATIYLTQFCTFALVTFAVLGIGLRYPREAALKLWGWAGVTATIGVCLILLRSSIPLWISVDVGNILIFCSLALTWLGARALDGRKLPWTSASCLMLSASALMVLIPNHDGYFYARSLLYSTSYLVFHLLTLATLLKSPNSRLPGYRVAIGLILVLIAGQLYRVYLALSLDNSAQMLSTALAIHNFATTLLEMAKFLAFVFIFIEKLELKLYFQAMHDELTGLYNRRAFYEKAAQHLADSPFPRQALLVMDLDFFKKVNDTYGHQTGDVVLVAFADVLRKVLRPFDAVYARSGGEEFVVLLSGDAATHARLIAEEIRQGCSAMLLHTPEGVPFKQTVSIGICNGAESSPDLRQLFMQADMALYHAKDNGRNQVCLSASNNAGETGSADPLLAAASTGR